MGFAFLGMGGLGWGVVWFNFENCLFKMGLVFGKGLVYWGVVG